MQFRELRPGIGAMSVLSAHVAGGQSVSSEWFDAVRGDLVEMERIFACTLAGSRPCVQRLVEHLEGYRGKRLRPALLLLTAKACGRIVPAHHTLAAVVEMVHTATLVHDDVLDSASIRRHVATVNALWGNQTSIPLRSEERREGKECKI